MKILNCLFFCMPKKSICKVSAEQLRKIRLDDAVDTFKKGSIPTHRVVERFRYNGNTLSAKFERIPFGERVLNVLKSIKERKVNS